MAVVLLDRAALITPSAPASLLGVLAARGVEPDLAGELLTHPNLPVDAQVPVGQVSVGALVRARHTGRLTTKRMVALFAAACARVQRAYLEVDPDAPGGCLVEFARGDVARHGRQTRAVVRLLALHPATPDGVHLGALEVLLGRAELTVADRWWVLAAMLRHPDRLEDLVGMCRDRWVHAQGVDLAAASDSVAVFLAAAVAEGADDLDWARAVAAVGQVAGPVGALAVGAARGWNVARVLTCPRVPAAAKVAVLTQWFASRTDELLVGPLLQAATPVLAVSGPELVVALARSTRSMWELLCPVDLTFDLPAGALEELWRAALHVYGTESTAASARPRSVRLADYGFQLATQPGASAQLRAQVVAVIEEYASSAVVMWAPWFRPAIALGILADIETFGFAGAGRLLVVKDVLVDPRFGASMGVSLFRLAGAGLGEVASLLQAPSAARAFDVLTDSFAGTIDELAHAASAVTG